MSPELLLPLCTFAAVSSITPGPNNTMILASGLNYGFMRSLPHLFGITCGFTFMIFATGMGLHVVFEQVPMLQTILKYGGAIYLLWLAWKLAHAAPMSGEQAALSKPMTFFGAAAFQWINPKAWVMALSALTTYLPQGFTVIDAAMLAGIFGLIGVFCVGAWAMFGVAMRRVLQDARSVRIFNIVMALLLVGTLYPMLA
ncbi:Threonine/homoserine/homoserine lactone efflux protein [Duganella sp. CF402]|uniref:LysE family translocator n=1 Tax=unclassified Duganella TaxID=2636909 RepID=UPI0008C2A43F|nr:MULTISPECIES: LysE family translocator [unclassified Duganella]RZT04319.1 threonine/homoserine/homoserine lactone efflux protein [Duganella sp. BK701]SEM40470.1 Threonine/homoserine/homoserine lactone efflux protein [Duganella sp. CF402]